MLIALDFDKAEARIKRLRDRFFARYAIEILRIGASSVMGGAGRFYSAAML